MKLADLLGVSAALVSAAAAVAGLIVGRHRLQRPSKTAVPAWAVARPAEFSDVTAALLSGPAGAGVTAGLCGAGGFGKTILALMVGADRKVERHFRGGVYWVTLGPDVQGSAAVAAKVNDLIRQINGENATFVDPERAGERLGTLLDTGPRRLVILDDVWKREHLAPFLEGGRRCSRLVTTRIPRLLEGRGTAVRVDQMSPAQASAVLKAGLPPLETSVADRLLTATGRWPLLLRLVNEILTNAAGNGADVAVIGSQLLGRLAAGGPAAVDELPGEAGASPQATDPQERARAVRATIEASTRLLDPGDIERFAELAVFASREPIPFSLAARLWRATAGLDELQASQLCHRLSGLALMSPADGGRDGLVLHEVIRDFLRDDLGPQRLITLNGVLMDVAASKLPEAGTVTSTGAAHVAWWELAQSDGYLWSHLIEHLVQADRRPDAEAVAVDLRWVGARLRASGPAAPAADLSAVGTPRTARLQAVLARIAHLLVPAEPPDAVVDILHSRVMHDRDWGPQVADLKGRCSWPRLVTRWPLPDLPSEALLRVLTGHTAGVNAVAVAPDSSWLATGGVDGTVRLWDAVSGKQRAVLSGHDRWVTAVVIAPDGSWLATSSHDGSVRVWDSASGQQRTVFRSRFSHGLRALAVAPDGSWLATGGDDGMVRVWDAVSGRPRVAFAGHSGGVNGVAVAPDGSWLATGGDDGKVRIWDAVSGRQQAVHSGQARWMTAVAIAPDGSWLTSGSSDGTIWTWHVGGGGQGAALVGHAHRVGSVAVTLDGRRLITGSDDATVRIWDTGSARKATSVVHTHDVLAMAAAPDGSWLATGNRDGTVRVWDPASGGQRTTLTPPDGVLAVTVAHDGTWLATGGYQGMVRIWDAVRGRQRAVLAGHEEQVNAVAAAPDGKWLATGSSDETVRIWDVASGQERAVLSGLGAVTAVAICPDAKWLAAGDQDGKVRIWDAASGDVRAVLAGYGGRVNAVAVGPDGSWLATSTADRKVRVWDAASGDLRAVLAGHGGRVNAVAVAPDGSRLATGSDDQTVRVWGLAGGQVQALMRVENTVSACAWIGLTGLAAGGPAGLYLFDFYAGTPALH